MDVIADAAPAPMDISFAFDAVCQKAWQDDKGKMFVRACASDDKLDLQRDRMSTSALNKMAEAAKKGVPFLETHRSVFEFGRTVGGEVAEVEEDGKKVQKFFVDVELDGDFPQARKLFKEVAAKDCKRQLSIGGKLNLKNREAVHVEMTPTGLARTINDLDLDHVASTREKQAANPRTSFTEAITKALDEAEKGLAKENAGDQNGNVPQIKLSPEVLAALEKVVEMAKVGGKNMDVPETPEAEETTPEAEETPKDGEKCVKKENGEEEGNGETEDEKKKPAPKPKAKEEEEEEVMDVEDMDIKGNDAATAADLINDISVLLSKKEPFPGAATPFGKKGDEEEDEDEETEEKAIVDSLWATRYILAKQVTGASLGAGEKLRVADIIVAGPYAPRSGAGKAGMIPDKAPKGSTTDMGGSAVSDSRRDIQVGGEIKPTAPTAKSAMKHTMAALKESEKLPQDLSTFGKDLSDDILTKSMDITKSMMETVIEKMAEENARVSMEIQKSVEGLGDMVNDSTKRLAAMEARISRVEKFGGVSQSGPKGGRPDGEEETRSKRGIWGGVFGKAAGDALARY